MNKIQSSARYGVNSFADMTKEEFTAAKLMPGMITGSKCNWPWHLPVGQNTAPPASWDWRQKGAVTPVKDQAQCGSCWAFSTVGAIEGAWFLGGHPLTSLSEQNLVDCSKSCLQSEPQLCNSGCGGGLMWLAMGDVITAGGIDTEAAYPYAGVDQDCAFDPKKVGAQLSNWTGLPNDEVKIAAALVTAGPVSVALNADPLMGYTSGIIDDPSCDASGMDHAVLIVGYGTENNKPYWIVKNSWGESFGEKGYFRMVRGKGMCGIDGCACLPIIKK